MTKVLLSVITYFTVFMCGALLMAIWLPYLANNGFSGVSSWDYDTALGFWQEVNSTDSYYCVWTDNISLKEIESTDYHEACHALVNKDYEHFCS